MDNVVFVDFGQRVQEPILFSFVDQVSDSIDAYLDQLRSSGLDEDDVADVRDAIVSYDIYAESDDVIQSFADTFNSQYL